VFNPVINRIRTQTIEFTRVLHVPELRNNLISCLYLTKHKNFEIIMKANKMEFKQNGTFLFTTTAIQNSTCALLNGITQAITEYANISVTLSIDINLWHRRLAHHNYNDVKKMIKEKLVTGLNIISDVQPDPICEPCLAGKMHSNPFPSSSSKTSKPLELIHTDFYGFLSISTPKGYCYWITFIDDYTRFKAVLHLKKESDAFEAFKIFKAYAENQLNYKILAM
jgi:hypothetical protein